jgi:hypothetical protein
MVNLPTCSGALAGPGAASAAVFATHLGCGETAPSYAQQFGTGLLMDGAGAQPPLRRIQTFLSPEVLEMRADFRIRLRDEAPAVSWRRLKGLGQVLRVTLPNANSCELQPVWWGYGPLPCIRGVILGQPCSGSSEVLR